MQITVKSVKVLKIGTNDYGEWKLVKVITDEDVEYTTLAKEADQIPGGSTIVITDMDEDEKGKKFKKFEIVTAGTAPPPAPSDMSKDEWAEKDLIKRASIEGQNALTNLTQLTIAGIKLENCPALLREALQCKITGFMGATSTNPKTEAKPQEKTKVEKDKVELWPGEVPPSVPEGNDGTEEEVEEEKRKRAKGTKALLAKLQESITLCNWDYKM
ncbi:hypothetical protein LCGC14_3084350, partial [marine sediment metagenome]